ncbi:hypothetical protein [Rhizobium sp. C1]|uniref:hypothetical protein n=1 Tax=Rhizobium sp. C1 TaxID=1349799 RepID=UPI001E350604|nr:hypothetical protein [Rhizobium sp. C1]MCD2178935.1 hypothetical protein [Rhizobium sp. C1]
MKPLPATGDALNVIEQHIVAINGYLDAIATSAREQSAGLAEINTAVNRMHQTTQRNAATVKEVSVSSPASVRVVRVAGGGCAAAAQSWEEF